MYLEQENVDDSCESLEHNLHCASNSSQLTSKMAHLLGSKSCIDEIQISVNWCNIVKLVKLLIKWKYGTDKENVRFMELYEAEQVRLTEYKTKDT